MAREHPAGTVPLLYKIKILMIYSSGEGVKLTSEISSNYYYIINFDGDSEVAIYTPFLFLQKSVRRNENMYTHFVNSKW